MRLYYVGGEDEIAEIERDGFTELQDDVAGGDAICHIVVLQKDNSRRFGAVHTAGVAVDFPEDRPESHFVSGPIYEVCAEDINQFCKVTRLTDRELTQLQVGSR